MRMTVEPVLVLLELCSVVRSPDTFVEGREDAGGSSHGQREGSSWFMIDETYDG